MKTGVLKIAAFLCACIFLLMTAGCAMPDRTGRQPDTDIKGNRMGGTENEGIGTRLFDKGNMTPGTSPGNDLLPNATPGNDRLGDGLNDGLNNDNNIGATGNNDARTRADNIRNMLERNGDIKDVNVVTSGDDVIIGFVPVRARTRSSIEKLKKDIAKRVRQLDPKAKNIYISEKAEHSSEIGRLYNRMVPDNAGNAGSRLGEAGNRLDTEIKRLIEQIPFVSK